MKRKPPFPWVRVTWLDAYSEDEWTWIDEYEMHDQLVTSEGYLVRENERYILLAPNVSYDPGAAKWSFYAASGVPREMIRGKIKIVRKAPGGQHGRKGKGRIHSAPAQGDPRGSSAPGASEVLPAAVRGNGGEGHAG